MATTKVVIAIWNNITLTAGAGDTTTAAVTLDDSYGAALHLKITNGATGPTLPAQIQVEVSADNAEWYDLGGAYVGGVANNGIYDWGGIPINIGVEYLRLVAGSNTDQDVVVDADISEVTAV